MKKISLSLILAHAIQFQSFAQTPNLADFVSNRDINVSSKNGIVVNQNHSIYNLSLNNGFGILTQGQNYSLMVDGTPNQPTSITEIKKLEFGHEINTVDLKNDREMKSWTKCKNWSMVPSVDQDKKPITRVSSFYNKSSCITIIPSMCEKLVNIVRNLKDYDKTLEQCETYTGAAFNLIHDKKFEAEVKNESYQKANLSALKKITKLTAKTFGKHQIDESIYSPNASLTPEEARSGNLHLMQLRTIVGMCDQSRSFWKKDTSSQTKSDQGSNQGETLKGN